MLSGLSPPKFSVSAFPTVQPYSTLPSSMLSGRARAPVDLHDDEALRGGQRASLLALQAVGLRAALKNPGGGPPAARGLPSAFGTPFYGHFF